VVNNCGELSVYVSDANGHILTEVKNGVKAKRGDGVCQCVTVRGRGLNGCAFCVGWAENMQ